MGHRAEKQAYGSSKAFKLAKDATKPEWQKPKIGRPNDNGGRTWNRRHVNAAKPRAQEAS